MNRLVGEEGIRRVRQGRATPKGFSFFPHVVIFRPGNSDKRTRKASDETRPSLGAGFPGGVIEIWALGPLEKAGHVQPEAAREPRGERMESGRGP